MTVKDVSLFGSITANKDVLNELASHYFTLATYVREDPKMKEFEDLYIAKANVIYDALKKAGYYDK